MRHLLLVFIVLFGIMPDVEAAYRRREVFHTIEVGARLMGAETEVLDCKYGDFNAGMGRGYCFNVTGRMPVADFFYVKWRDRTTGQIYEERVDLKSRLPPPRKMEGTNIHWMIEDNQLYLHLIPYSDHNDPSLNRLPPGKPPNGPAKYDNLDVKTIYPDNAPPRVHGLTPTMEATRERWRAEHAAQKATEEKARREAAERGECVFIDEVLGLCKPVRQRRQRP